MLARALLLVGLACVVAHAAPRSDVYVLDNAGLVPDAEIDVVRAKPLACHCGPKRETEMLDHAPACSCPAALAMYRDALASCARPQIIDSVHTDAHGHALVTQIANTSLVATSPRGEVWVTAPSPSGPFTLELQHGEPLHVKIVARADQLHAAVLWPNGRCVPLQRHGDEWNPTGPIDDDDDRVVVAENIDGIGIATVYNGNTTADIAITPPRIATGECTPGSIAHLDGAFQRGDQLVDHTGHYTFPALLGFSALITCTAHGKVTETELWDPQSGTIEEVASGGISSDDDVCVPVDVTDGKGHPVADAMFSSMMMAASGIGTGTGGGTDANGHGCTTEYANELWVDAPDARGGSCAGHVVVKLTHPAQTSNAPPHVKVTLPIRSLPRTTFHGRVVTPEGVPVVNAQIDVSSIDPDATPTCSTRGNGILAHSALDGSFALPELPTGKLSLLVRHDWYLSKTEIVRSPGPAPDIVVTRGATWTGRVLDPDGHLIDACDIFVTKPDTSLELVHCSTTGFALSVLPSGVSTIEVRLHHHALGEERSYFETATFAGSEHRVGDIHWPAGKALAGTVVDPTGKPVPHARVAALPANATNVQPDRIHPDEVQVLADATGHFAFVHLRTGIWRLSVGGPTVDVAAGTLDARITTAK